MPSTLKPIELEDITRYQIPSGLRYSPDGKRLAFQVTRADLDKNMYHTDVYIAENGAARRVTWSIDASVVLWKDDNTLILRRALPDAEPGVTELFTLSMDGGEAAPWITLPFALAKLEKFGGGYVAQGNIDRDDPDAYLDDKETRKKKAEKKKEEEDYHVADEVPYWFNGRGYTNGQRNALFLVKIQDGRP